jgi:hypothetical protein
MDFLEVISQQHRIFDRSERDFPLRNGDEAESNKIDILSTLIFIFFLNHHFALDISFSFLEYPLIISPIHWQFSAHKNWTLC